jgi:hypothetical protein
VFGGFTPTAWNSSNSWGADSSKRSFLFRVKDSRNSAPWAFPISNPSQAIYCNATYGPTFGNGHDLHVADSCNQNTNSYTNPGGDYVNDTGIDRAQVFTGQRNFTVKDIEVFSITD